LIILWIMMSGLNVDTLWMTSKLGWKVSKWCSASWYYHWFNCISGVMISLECSKLLVWALVGSNQRLWNCYWLFFH
jgi:hypothetical protein